MGSILAGIDVDPTQGRILLEANFGLIQQDDGGYAWSCHEVLTRSGSIATPLYARGPDGTLLSVVTELQGRSEDVSLYVSVDAGCSWADVDFGGTLATELAWVGDTALVGADDGRIFRSEDSGETWTATDLALSHAVRAFSVQAGVVYTVELVGFRAHVHKSEDGGLSWESVEVGVGLWRNDGLEAVRVAGVVNGELLLMIDALGGDTLVRAPPREAAIAVLEVGGDLVDAHLDADGVLWVLEDGRSLHRSEDGSTFTLDEVAPVAVGLGVDDDTVWATGFADFNLNGSLLSHAPDWEPLLPLNELVGPLSCPAETEHVAVCEPLWPELKARIEEYERVGDTGTDSDSDRPDDTDSEVTPPPEDCGCSATGGGAWLGLLALLSARGRRRGRREGRQSS